MVVPVWWCRFGGPIADFDAVPSYSLSFFSFVSVCSVCSYPCACVCTAACGGQAATGTCPVVAATVVAAWTTPVLAAVGRPGRGGTGSWGWSGRGVVVVAAVEAGIRAATPAETFQRVGAMPTGTPSRLVGAMPAGILCLHAGGNEGGMEAWTAGAAGAGAGAEGRERSRGGAAAAGGGQAHVHTGTNERMNE